MKVKAKPPKYAAADVVKALRARYPASAYAMIEEVGNATGWQCRRHGDVVVMSLWPSRGLDVFGFEVKIARNDWQKELADPEKAEALQQYCDRWWVVSANKAVLESEVPANWGLLELKGSGLHVVKEAPKLEPKPLDREFVAAMMRAGQKSVKAQRDEIFEEGRKLGEEKGSFEHQSRLAEVEGDLLDLKRRVEGFEEESGIKLSDGWSGERVGRALRLFMGYQKFDSPTEALKQAAESLEAKAEQIRQEMARIEAAQLAAGGNSDG